MVVKEFLFHVRDMFSLVRSLYDFPVSCTRFVD